MLRIPSFKVFLVRAPSKATFFSLARQRRSGAFPVYPLYIGLLSELGPVPRLVSCLHTSLTLALLASSTSGSRLQPIDAFLANSGLSYILEERKGPFPRSDATFLPLFTTTSCAG